MVRKVSKIKDHLTESKAFEMLSFRTLRGPIESCHIVWVVIEMDHDLVANDPNSNSKLL